MIREQYDYDVFGFPYLYTANGSKLTSSQQFGNRFLFTGREWLKDLRVYDYRHRHYQPELGRFLQPDPIQFEAGDYNLYRYCHNDPVNKTDPMGLEIQIDPYASAEVQANAPAWLNTIAAQSNEAASKIFQLMVSSNVHIITSFGALPTNPLSAGRDNLSLTPRAAQTTPNTPRDAHNGTGTGTTIEIDPSKTDCAECTLAHDLDHAADMDKGRHAPLPTEDEKVFRTPETYKNHPSEIKANQFGNEIRKSLEKKDY